MTSQDLDNIDWSFLREQEPWQFGQQKCDCCGERFCFLAVFKYPELEGHQFSSAKLVLHSQQPVGRGTLQFAHDFTKHGIPVHSVPTGAGLGWSDTSRTRLHRIQLPAATERSEATYFPEGTPGGEEGESTTSDSILREAGNEVGRALRYGEPQEGRQGQRSDLLALKSALDEGSTDLQLWKSSFLR